MSTLLIKNVTIVNEGLQNLQDIVIENQYITKIASPNSIQQFNGRVIDGTGLHLLPGMIDDQVHFREPGLTHKATIYTEAKAAVAGGITTYMEMPNTVPNTLTQELLQEKYDIAAKDSLANYSFYMGAGNDNLSEVLKTDKKNVCGVKVFMGSSTGNMLVDNPDTLKALFSECELLIATHCEDEATIKANLKKYSDLLGDDIPVKYHPIIRNTEACYRSSSMAVELATKHNTKLHILHISSEKEVALFDNTKPLSQKRITAEACIHHMWFSDEDYDSKGNFIKWNPAVKSASDRSAIIDGVNQNRIDVIATDHAPHTLEEKSLSYLKAPSGGPLVQHALLALFDLVKQGKFTLEQIAQKSAHNVAELFEIDKRGFIREGYFADLVLVDLSTPSTVTKESILYQCGWSPFINHTFSSTIKSTIVSGNLVYDNGVFDESKRGMRLTFNR
jgi:dihydroorotase